MSKGAMAALLRMARKGLRHSFAWPVISFVVLSIFVLSLVLQPVGTHPLYADAPLTATTTSNDVASTSTPDFAPSPTLDVQPQATTAPSPVPPINPPNPTAAATTPADVAPTATTAPPPKDTPVPLTTPVPSKVIKKTEDPTATPSPTPSPTPTVTPTVVPSDTATPAPTLPEEASPTPTDSYLPAPLAASPEATGGTDVLPTPTPTASATPTPAEAVTPTPQLGPASPDVRAVPEPGSSSQYHKDIFAPLPFYAPFPAGELWHAGGDGSFYGQGYHTDAANSYYCVDFNKGAWPDGEQEDDGEPVLAAADGLINRIYRDAYGAWTVEIYHYYKGQTLRTLYLHLKEDPRIAPGVRVGQNVIHGTQIGLIGSTGLSTGPHLHFGLWLLQNGSWVSIRPEPMDGQYLSNGANITSQNTPLHVIEPGAALPADDLPFYVSHSFSPDSPSNAEAVTITVKAGSTSSSVSKVEVLVNTAGDGTTNGEWKSLGLVEGSSGSVTWDTKGYIHGTHRIGFNIEDEHGRQNQWDSGLQPVVSYILDRQPPRGALVVNPKPDMTFSSPLDGDTVPSVGSGKVTVDGAQRFQPVDDNLLRNSSFEVDANEDGVPDNWNQLGPKESFQMDSTAAASGSRSLKVTPEGADSTDAVTQTVMLENGKTYTFSMSINASSAVTQTSVVSGTYALVFKGADGQVKASSEPKKALTKEWERLSVSYTKAADDGVDSVGLVITGAVGTVIRADAAKLEMSATASDYRGEGMLVEEGTTNLLRNPSLERFNGATPQYWEELDSLQTAKEEDLAYSGQHSRSLEGQGNGGNALYQTMTLSDDTTYTFSGWVYVPNLTKGRVYLTFSNANFDDVAKSEDIITGNGGWKRYSVTYAKKAGDGVDRVAVVTGDNPEGKFYVDALQVEQKPYPTSYADGSMGNGYAWLGEPNTSPSVRQPTNLTYPTKDNLPAGKGTISLWVKSNPDSNMWNDKRRHVLLAGQTFGDDWQGLMLYKEDSNELKFNVRDSQDRIIATNVADYKADRWYNVVVTWDNEAKSRYIYVNGVPQITSSAEFPLVKLPEVMWVGSWAPDNNSWSDAVISGVSIWNRALKAGEVESLFKSAAPIEAGQAVTRNSQTTLVTNAIDDLAGIDQMRFSNDGTTWTQWEKYASSKSWTLTPGDGSKTVYVQYRDRLGNIATYASWVRVDTSAPAVTTTSPQDSNGQAVLTSPISVTFSKDIDPATLKKGVVNVKDDHGAVAGTVTYNAPARTLIFQPSGKLSYDTTYQVTLGRDVSDTAGNRLSGDYSWSFKTRGLPSPQVPAIASNSGS